MKVEVSGNSIQEATRRFKNSSMVKVRDRHGSLMAVMQELSGGVLMLSRGDNDFVSYCEQHGIPLEAPE
jgi:hypothetical protein